MKQSFDPKSHMPAAPEQNFFQVLKRVLTFSLPIMLNTLLGILPTLASIWILSRLGKEQLAAAALATPTFYTILTFFIAGFSAIGIKIGHSRGKKAVDEVRLWVRNGFFLALLFSVLAAALLLNAHQLLLLFGQDPHLVSIAKPFFTFGAAAMVVMFINATFNQYFSGIGHPKIAFILSMLTLPLIVGLSYVLVLGRMGLPQLGLGGINCAALIVDSLVMVIAIFIACMAKWSKPYRIFSDFWHCSYTACIDLIRLGWPISVQVSAEILAITVCIYILGLFGVSVLAASQLTGQYVMMFVMLGLGLQQGISILISHAYGEKNIIAISKITQAGVFISLVISSFFAIGFLFFPQRLVDIYLNIDDTVHNQLVDYAIDFMRIAALYLLFDGVRYVMTSVLRGLQDPKVPMKISVACLWLIGLPLAYLGGIFFHGGPVVLRLLFALGVIVATIWLCCRCKQSFAKLKVSFGN